MLVCSAEVGELSAITVLSAPTIPTFPVSLSLSLSLFPLLLCFPLSVSLCLSHSLLGGALRLSVLHLLLKWEVKRSVCVFVCVCRIVCVRFCEFIYLYPSLSLPLSFSLYICMNVCMYVCTHTHTHTHTAKCWPPPGFKVRSKIRFRFCVQMWWLRLGYVARECIYNESHKDRCVCVCVCVCVNKMTSALNDHIYVSTVNTCTLCISPSLCCTFYLHCSEAARPEKLLWTTERFLPRFKFIYADFTSLLFVHFTSFLFLCWLSTCHFGLKTPVF